MGPRASKDTTKNTTPPRTASGTPHVAAGQNHDFFTQYAVTTERSIGELKTTMEGLVKASDKQAEKLDKLTEEFHTAKGAFSAAKWMIGILGGLVLLLISSMLTVMLKHFKLI